MFGTGLPVINLHPAQWSNETAGYMGPYFNLSSV